MLEPLKTGHFKLDINTNIDHEQHSNIINLEQAIHIFKTGKYDLDKTTIETPKENISFSSFFHSLDTNSELYFQEGIYYGQATIESRDTNKYFIVEFIEVKSYAGINDNPSFTILATQFDTQKYNWYKEYLNSDKTFTCFVYGIPLKRYGKYIYFPYTDLVFYLFEK